MPHVGDDGNVDVVTASPGPPPQVFVHPGDGAGGFGGPAIHPIYNFSRLDLGDLDGDGRADVVADVPGNPWRFQLHRSLADHLDAPVDLEGFTYTAFELGDVDGDGRADIVAHATGEPPRVEVYLSPLLP